MELPEKIESNGVAYLQSLVASFPAYFTAAMIHAGESDEDKENQVIQVVCGEAENEDPPFSGNFWFPVEIQLRTPLLVQTDSEETAGDVAALDKHKAMAAILSDAICITDLPAQINTAAQAQTDANLKAFAVIGFTERKPLREQNDDIIMSGFALKIYANSNAASA